MKRMFATLLALCLLLGCLPGCAKKPTVEERLALAEKLFAEQNYEETILTLNQVIEIEPMDPRAYLRLAEVYIAQGMLEEALALLELGFEKTGDPEIARRMQEVTEPEEAPSNAPGDWYTPTPIPLPEPTPA